MLNVADNRDLKLPQIALGLADREDIEHRLGRVRVRAVAGVDDAHVWWHVRRNQVCGAGAVVAYDE